jgi:hypothetical protein
MKKRKVHVEASVRMELGVTTPSQTQRDLQYDAIYKNMPAKINASLYRSSHVQIENSPNTPAVRKTSAAMTGCTGQDA